MIGYHLMRIDGTLLRGHPTSFTLPTGGTPTRWPWVNTVPTPWITIPGYGMMLTLPGGDLWASYSGPTLVELESPDDEQDCADPPPETYGVHVRRTVRVLRIVHDPDFSRIIEVCALAAPDLVLREGGSELHHVSRLLRRIAMSDPIAALWSENRTMKEVPGLVEEIVRARPGPALRCPWLLHHAPDLHAETLRLRLAQIEPDFLKKSAPPA